MTAIGPIEPDISTRGEAAAAGLAVATVAALIPGGVLLHRNGMPVEARVALSCLVAPEPGDTVATLNLGEVWVMGILSRPVAGPLRVLAETDAVLGAPARRLDITFGALNVQAETADFFIGKIQHIGASLTAHLGQLKLIGGLFETIAERLHLTAKRSQRVIEETDATRARRIEQTAEAEMHLQAESAFLTAGTVIRMDAGQIHMG